jgi:hypothetical protein
MYHNAHAIHKPGFLNRADVVSAFRRSLIPTYLHSFFFIFLSKIEKFLQNGLPTLFMGGVNPKSYVIFHKIFFVVPAFHRPKFSKSLPTGKNSIFQKCNFFLKIEKNCSILPNPKIGGYRFGPKSYFYPRVRGGGGAYSRGTALGEEIKYGVSPR